MAEAGQSLVVFIVFFGPVLATAAAISVDLGRVYLARVAYEQAATAAADAGATEVDACDLGHGEIVLDDGSPATSCDVDPGQPSAQAEAAQALEANLAGQRLKGVEGLSVTVVQNGQGGGGWGPGGACFLYPTVVVSFKATVGGLLFAGASFGRSTDTLSVSAAASPSEAATGRYAPGGAPCG